MKSIARKAIRVQAVLRTHRYLRMSSVSGLLISLAMSLSACSGTPGISSTPFTPTPSTAEASATPRASATQGTAATPTPVPAESAASLFKAGVSYPDTPNDMAVSFLDVVGFQANVSEEPETLQVVLHLRDIPETAPQRQIKNFVEYWWEVGVFLDPSKATSENASPDYDLSVLTTYSDNSGGQGMQTPQAGEPVMVAFNKLWDQKNLYNNLGEIVGTLDAIADPSLDTLTLTARIPGITSDAVFNFSTFYYDGSLDGPDNSSPPEQAVASPPPAAATEGSAPGATAVAYDPEQQLIPAGPVRAYPGPKHYSGDVLTFEIQLEGDFSEASNLVTMTLDDRTPLKVPAELLFGNRIVLPLALDTTGLSGAHRITFSTPAGSVNDIYTFEVLPASQREANEQKPTWVSREIECCILHYIPGTAAARDIDFITDHLDRAAADFLVVTGKQVDPKLQIYFIDRMWGNGGFGGTGELVISYTDRYYGPTVGAVGLETLARHEFTHAAGVGLDRPGDGVNFNTEGLAVYVAGGHYKPEPLDKRGGALYDLGYFVPVGQSIAQHEVSYLYSAAMLTYIADTYGKAKLWDFLATDPDPQDGQPAPLEFAIRLAFGISIQQFSDNFRAWLAAEEPGEQLDDLRLTIALQDLRRQYQDTYAPPPYFIYASTVDAVVRPEYLPAMIREASAPPNIAAELIIQNAQRAIVDGDYAAAEELVKALAEVVSTGKFEDPVARDYLEIVLALRDRGYEAVSLVIEGDQATAQVIVGSTVLTTRQLGESGGVWHVMP
jgi:hypothetical protein